MISDKKAIQQLAAIFLAKDITNIVISPGSRNAPIINTLAGSEKFNCFSVVDERSAAFFALGMAIKTGKTVALSCTSGTAALNYAPAVAEAFYQKVPLLVLTADRPVEWIDQADSQTIRQRNIFSNYIKKSFELPQHISTDDDLWFANRIINEAVNACRFPVKGPVQINLPFTEPLYNLENADLPEPRIINYYQQYPRLADEQLEKLAGLINGSPKVMFLAGQHMKNPELDALMENIARLPQTILLSETNSNLENKNGIVSIDKVLATIDENEEENFWPGVLITFGDAIVSKRIKTFLRKTKTLGHLHINPDPNHPDTYQNLRHSVFMQPESFLGQIAPFLKPVQSDFQQLWLEKNKHADKQHTKYLENCEYSDLAVFDKIFRQLPANCDLHLANSSPVRYGQLFRHHPGITHFSNRGTSGIDGCTSTAAGTAFAGKKTTVLVTGDLSFYYDSNGLWNPYLDNKLKIIVINNGGGNIFRIIPGPAETDHLEKFYETKHLEKTEGFAKTFGLEYFHACSLNELEEKLPDFFNEKLQKPALLEIITHRKKSPEVLKNYFKFLKEK
ncbi:MAG: 2-succinyl-5-enolpyruvyl-6-hydroxy-3-cyclohexene-1-carboxylic-acid synthase [Bacteroidales bacterium]|nr:2-succinyl-5-enolpyruvyl-6-hydroxy-3-cyclohexene-1-carboxylic-acid synthase [Bacteroidales bacterium]